MIGQYPPGLGWELVVEVIWEGLARNVDRLRDLLLSPGSGSSVYALLLALLIAVGFYVLRRARRGRVTRWRVLVRALFPRRMLVGKSTKADIGWFLFNTFAYGSIFGLAGFSYVFLTAGVTDGLVALFGAPSPTSLPGWAASLILTVVMFLAYELGYWIDHWLKHRVPFLWEMHKVHHRAEVLTPLTAFRMHPLDTVLFANILTIVASLATGVTAYTLGDTTQEYMISGMNVILVAFMYVVVNLQHTHIWIAFTGVAGRLFVSPAHHQIHHSADPIHFNKNLGSCLAIWDWAFGTLHVPAKTREVKAFGVLPKDELTHTITGELINPFGRSLASAFSWAPGVWARVRRWRPVSARVSG